MAITIRCASHWHGVSHRLLQDSCASHWHNVVVIVLDCASQRHRSNNADGLDEKSQTQKVWLFSLT